MARRKTWAGIAVLTAIPLVLLRLGVAAQQPPLVRTIALDPFARALLTGYVAPLSVAVDAPTNRVFVASAEEDAMSVLDARSGALVGVVALAQPAGAPYTAISVVADERNGHVLTTAGNTIAMRNGRTGALLRMLSLGYTPTRVSVDEQGKRIFAVDGAGHSIHILDARSGALLRTIATSGDTNSIAVVARTARAFAGSLNGVAIYDAHSGVLPHTVTFGHTATFVDAVDQHAARVIVTNTFARSVSFLDGRDGHVVHTTHVPLLPYGAVVDGRRGYVFVLDAAAPDGVTVLDERSGAIVRTISVGGIPDAMAVDERSGRVYIADSGGVIVTPDPWRSIPPWLPRHLHDWLPFLPRPGVTTRMMPPSLVIIDEAEI